MIDKHKALLIASIFFVGQFLYFESVINEKNELLSKSHTRYLDMQDNYFDCQDNMAYGGAMESTTVTATMYYPVEGQTDSTPNQLADGTYINVDKASSYRYLAMSRNMLSRWGGEFNYGDFVLIENADKYNGIWQVKDTMSPRFHNRIDFLCTVGTKPFKYENVIVSKNI